MKPIEAREMAVEELRDKLRDLKEEHFNLRFQIATGQLDNHRRIRIVKRQMALIKTILRQRELAEYDQLEAAGEARS
jgi:large subunit ribosomal protein L29